MKRLRIYHRESGLTLREFLRKFSLKPSNTARTYHPRDLDGYEVSYITNEHLLPGFTYNVPYAGDQVLWLSADAFRVVIGPVPEESLTTFIFKEDDDDGPVEAARGSAAPPS